MPYKDPDKRKQYSREAVRKWRAKNPDYFVTYGKKWRSENPTAGREWWYRSRYGIAIRDYNEMLASQEKRCVICGTDNPGGRGKHFHVDHDHETKRIRGLLCSGCNTKLGWFEKHQTEVLNYLMRSAQVVA